MVSLLFSFRGRINRAQYWTGCVVAGVIAVVLLFVMMFAAGPTMTFDKSGAGALRFLATMGMIFAPFSVILGWSGMALQTKRFHDHGRGGAWCMLPYAPIMMVIATLVGGVMAGESAGQIARAIQPWTTILVIINFGFLAYLGFMPGQNGPNIYGVPPGSPSVGPQAPVAQPSKGAAFLMGSAEKAMERAIAEQAMPAPVTPRPRSARSQPAAVSSAPASFGRRVAPR